MDAGNWRTFNARPIRPATHAAAQRAEAMLRVGSGRNATADKAASPSLRRRIESFRGCCRR